MLNVTYSFIFLQIFTRTVFIDSLFSVFQVLTAVSMLLNKSRLDVDARLCKRLQDASRGTQVSLEIWRVFSGLKSRMRLNTGIRRRSLFLYVMLIRLLLLRGARLPFGTMNVNLTPLSKDSLIHFDLVNPRPNVAWIFFSFLSPYLLTPAPRYQTHNELYGVWSPDTWKSLSLFFSVY